MGDLPDLLEGETRCLIDLLQGKAPLKSQEKYKRGWGFTSGSYSVAEGYRLIKAIPKVPPDPSQWNFVWSATSIPKIEFFCWTLAHNNVLTSDNLRKRGMEGPSRCPLCVSEEENADHLLLNCSFACEVWKDTLKIDSDSFIMPGNIQDLFTSWASRSPFNLIKKDLLRAGWMWLPKFICWKLWLERNNRIFREESCTPLRIITKIKALLGEALEAKAILKNNLALSNEEDH